MNLAKMTFNSEFEVTKDLKPISTIEFMLNSGTVMIVPCTLTPEDFVQLWNNHLNRTIKICSGESNYVFIRRKQIASFRVMPIA